MAHPPKIKNIEAVKIIFLHPNVASISPHMDQVFIMFQKIYRKKLINDMLIKLEINKTHAINLLENIHITITAWEAVSLDTVLLPCCCIFKETTLRN